MRHRDGTLLLFHTIIIEDLTWAHGLATFH
ncbi:hypothetical protein HBB04_04788 [Pseudomonas coronafaciens]|nr:hypothetical protein HBB04_04788 [Pseudomonas coronafaciens]